MKKIRVFQIVKWRSAEREYSGKVKRVMGDHVEVESNGSMFIVHRSNLSNESDEKQRG